ADLRLSGGGAVAEGSVSLDTLINLAPFGLRVDFAASVSISFLGMNLLAISLSGTLTGPSPWHVHGTVSISLFMFSVSLSLDVSFGSSAAQPPAVPPVNLIGLLTAEVGKPANWLAVVPGNGWLRLPDAPPGTFRVHPLARLSFHQRVAPLAIHLDRLGPAAITGPSTVTILQAELNGHPVTATPDVLDDFAPANFLNLTDDRKLAAPAFQTQQAGVDLAEPAPDVDALGAADIASLTFDLEFVDPAGELPTTLPATLAGVAPAAVRPTGLAPAAVRPTGLARAVRPGGRRPVTVRPRPSRWAELAGDPAAMS
ncbi:MAG TPA: DUF6603 domain-containing protein, partial [Jatrophihabitans sp.]|nr:DUF6603 domain-containing protein [Jatrophihabitans sp.]